uniref:ATP synthase F0 subunit 6 n=1 Tax=Parabreviscolex niepini TaxID=2041585 RepID=A0A3G2QWE2_9CEST|nr:ATP synthase F0 subunit 6 [Parabreviscolex niepini]AYO27338.1 ATP synthase F0 subunit 6 [Parabreviscolex niepini]
MLGWYSGVSSCLSLLYAGVICGFSWYYAVICYSLLFLFLLYRVPYAFSPYIFVSILWFVLFGMFISLFSCRVRSGVVEFMGSFVPVGTPLWVCPLVCLAETVSYLIRPVVLMLRPLINISLGCVGAAVVGGFSVTGFWWVVLLFLVFLYEVFIALVHWFIVTSILSFSVDH